MTIHLRGIVATALLLVTGGAAGAAAADPDPAPGYPTPVLTAQAQNEKAAAAESDALIAALGDALQTLDVGAVHHDAAPTPHLKKPDEFAAMGEPSLTRTAWWTVTVTPRALSKKLSASPPAGTTDENGPRWGEGLASSKGHRTIHYLFGMFGAPSTDAYTAPELDIEVEATKAGSALIADTYLSSRLVRAAGSFVTDPVSRIDVTKHTTGYDLATGKPANGTTQSSITDPSTIDDVVNALNGLPAVARYAGVHPCPMQTTTTRFFVVLRSASGDVVVRADSFDLICGIGGLSVRRDRARQGPALDSAGMPAVLETLFSRDGA